MITATRYHDISCGHRVVGHQNKCRFLHGHNYRFHFEIGAEKLDDLGMVLDFGAIKFFLCQYLEDTFDHKFLVWEKDPLLPQLIEVDQASIHVVDFNPTAENIAQFMVEKAGPMLLPEGTKLISCIVEETRKCSAKYETKD